MAIINKIVTTYLSNDITNSLRKIKGYKSSLDVALPGAGIIQPVLTNLPVIDKRMEKLSTNYFSRESAVRRRLRAR